MWDDQTIPTNGDELISFIRLIRSEYRPEKDGPILVHCSAGVGRTGTFIALDRLLQQFDKLSYNGYLDIYGTVLDMRRCRDKMVQTEVSLIFKKNFIEIFFEMLGSVFIYLSMFERRI
jgi:cadherin 5 type 2 (VE-cadherin)